TRDDDLATVRERLQRQEDRRRVVVDDEGVLGAGQPAQDRLDVAVAGAALLLDEIELEVGVRRGNCLQPREGERAQERAPKVGVEHDALRVDHRPQREGARAPGPLDDALGQELGRRRGGPVGEYADALLIQGLADEGGQTGPGEPPGVFVVREPPEELVDRRQAAQRSRALTAHRAPPRPSAERGRPLPEPRAATPGPSSWPGPTAGRAGPRPPRAPPRAPPGPPAKGPGRAARESTRRRGRR